jgi:hypothetical protein
MDALVLQFPDRRPLVRLALVPPMRRRRVPTSCACALVATLVAVGGARVATGGSTHAEARVVTVCAWAGEPNPSALPVCAERTRY